MSFRDQIAQGQANSPAPAPMGAPPQGGGAQSTGATGAPPDDRYAGVKAREPRTPFFKKGTYTAECLETRLYSSAQHGDKFNLIFRVVETTNPAHPVGSAAKIQEDVTPGPALIQNGGGSRVMGHILAMAGFQTEAQAELAIPNYRDLVNAAHGYTKRGDGTDNPFAKDGVANPFAGERYCIVASPAFKKDGTPVKTKTGEECCRYTITPVQG